MRAAEFPRNASGKTLKPQLREEMLAWREPTPKRRLRGHQKVALLVTAWNAFIDGEPLIARRFAAGATQLKRWPALRVRRAG